MSYHDDEEKEICPWADEEPRWQLTLLVVAVVIAAVAVMAALVIPGGAP